jgi:hypothetical protein
MTYTIPAPRLGLYPCRETGCDGTYEPYSDGAMVCYCGSVSRLSTDDVEIFGVPLVPLIEAC